MAARSPRQVPMRLIRLWPMPEGQPFHTLPYEELLAKLRSLTNLRVIRRFPVLDRLVDRDRPLPRLGGGADVVVPDREAAAPPL